MALDIPTGVNMFFVLELGISGSYYCGDTTSILNNLSSSFDKSLDKAQLYKAWLEDGKLLFKPELPKNANGELIPNLNARAVSLKLL